MVWTVASHKLPAQRASSRHGTLNTPTPIGGSRLSVCAISPAGCWTPGTHDETHATATIRRTRLVARLTSPIAPLALHSARIRRHALGAAALHGERLTQHQALEIARDLVACTGAPDLLGTSESLAPLDPLPCPMTLAWAAEDRIFPPAVNGARARELFPEAAYLELAAVGHVPMIDDPHLCADTILNVASRA